MAVKTRTSYYIEHDGQEFETEFQPEENTEKVTIKGDKAVVSYLADDSAQSGWYFDEFDQGTFINLDHRCRGTMAALKLQEGESIRDAIKRLETEHPGRVFLINKYEHGLCRYYRQGDVKTSAGIPDQRWDVSSGVAIFISPDDCPDPVKYCDSVMEEFTNWCNGDIHGVCHATYNRCSKDGEKWEWIEGETDECWGYIGYDNAQQVRDEEHEFRVKEL
jgi:hypothetical protein